MTRYEKQMFECFADSTTFVYEGHCGIIKTITKINSCRYEVILSPKLGQEETIVVDVS